MRTIIINAYIENPIRSSVDILDTDFVICADGAYDHAVKEEITPDLVVGDFDSIYADRREISSGIEVIRVPAEKDDTDTMLALKTALKRGYRECIFIGGMGGRIDHTLGVLAILSFGLDNGAKVEIRDGGTRLLMSDENHITIPYKSNNAYYFSLLAYDEACKDVNIRNAKYRLDDYDLTKSDPIGVSNEFTDRDVIITKSSGRLIVIVTPKDS